MNRIISKIDYILLGIVLLIVGMSLTTLIAFYFRDIGAVSQNLLIKHIISIILGLILAISIAQFDYRIFPTIIRPSFFIIIGLLVILLIFGSPIKGATSWFSIGGFSFQPAEFAKIIVILVMAQYFSRYYRKMYNLGTIIISAIPVGILIMLIFVQPDFGSASIIFLIWLGMIVFGGIQIIHLAILGGGMGLVGASLWVWILRDYQKQRILTFLNPSLDPLGSGYNTIQVLKSVSEGNMFGNSGSYIIVPEIQTDFIFSGLAQQWGFLGICIYSILLCALFMRIIYHITQMRDIFAKMILLGIIVSLFSQTFINIGMNIGILPITGITLPFMSYGGSSMISSWIMIGLIFSIISHQQSTKTLSIQNTQDIFG